MVVAVSVTVGLICYTVALIMYVFGQRRFPLVIIGFVIAGTLGIIGSQVGKWLRSGLTTVTSWVGMATGKFFGVAIGWLVVAAVVAYLTYTIVHLVTKQESDIDWRVLLASVTTPIGMVLIPGVVGGFIATVVGYIGWVFVWPITAGFGIH